MLSPTGFPGGDRRSISSCCLSPGVWKDSTGPWARAGRGWLNQNLSLALLSDFG